MFDFLSRVLIRAKQVELLGDIIEHQNNRVKELEAELAAARRDPSPRFEEVAKTVNVEAIRTAVIDKVLDDMVKLVKPEAYHTLEQFMRLRAPTDRLAEMQIAARADRSGVYVIDVFIPSMQRRLEVMV